MVGSLEGERPERPKRVKECNCSSCIVRRITISQCDAAAHMILAGDDSHSVFLATLMTAIAIRRANLRQNNTKSSKNDFLAECEKAWEKYTQAYGE